MATPKKGSTTSKGGRAAAGGQARASSAGKPARSASRKQTTKNMGGNAGGG